jgi:hypothetical protein
LVRLEKAALTGGFFVGAPWRLVAKEALLFCKKEPKNLFTAVADYSAAAAQKVLFLFSKRSAS